MAPPEDGSAPPRRPSNPTDGSQPRPRAPSGTPGPTAASSSSSASFNRPTVSMVNRGAAGGASRAQPRMTFRPVLPQRRKPSEGASATVKQEATPSSFGSAGGSGSGAGASSSTPGRGRGRGGARGGRGGRREIEMVASGPFALGTGSLSRSERSKRGGPTGAGGGGFAPTTSSSMHDLKPDIKPRRPGDASYRDPDKLRDAEEYSDPEEDIEIVDMGQVGQLDSLAPRSLPRVQEKIKKREVKKEKGKEKDKSLGIKPDPEDEEAGERARLSGPSSRAGTIDSNTSTPLLKTKAEEDAEEDQAEAEAEENEVVRGADALDLSESEEEEMMDDLVDDFVFDDSSDVGGGEDASNRLYLFQFPQVFPKFKAPKDKPAKAESDNEGGGSAAGPPPSALSSSPPGGSTKPKRSVAFAEGSKRGTATPPDTKPSGSSLDSEALKRGFSSGSDPLRNSSSQSGPEGMVGRLQVYRDGRVEMHFGSPDNPLVMEVAGGSQSSFLQDVALLDAKEKRATVLGEVHRKFTLSPSVEGMLGDWENHCSMKGEESESSSDEESVKKEEKR